MATAKRCPPNCEKRSPRCQSTCKTYLVGKIMRELENKERRKQIDMNNFLAEEMKAALKRRDKHRR